jgi:hypothetical protein
MFSKYDRKDSLIESKHLDESKEFRTVDTKVSLYLK